jgi:hypothetical protein
MQSELHILVRITTVYKGKITYRFLWILAPLAPVYWQTGSITLLAAGYIHSAVVHGFKAPCAVTSARASGSTRPDPPASPRPPLPPWTTERGLRASLSSCPCNGKARPTRWRMQPVAATMIQEHLASPSFRQLGLRVRTGLRRQGRRGNENQPLRPSH